ncbi:ARM repeat-containing protein [Neoconidiobolus thromboides FSU 785]|nr:ARM repeat-containing protein [Neoconidiobolus thromboides FSU 785]
MNNLSPRDQLIQVLVQASSQHSQELNLAVEKLKEWQTVTMFYPTLQDIAYDPNLPFKIRFQALIYLKNGIDRYWRKTAYNAMTEEDKISIKQRVLSQFHEAEKRLSLQNSVIISKIVRVDYPEEWSDVFQHIINSLEPKKESSEMENKLIQLQVLKTLQLCIKTLNSKVLSSGKKAFKQLAPLLGDILVPLYYTHYNELKKIFNNNYNANNSLNNEIQNQIVEELEYCILIIKCLKPLIGSGSKNFNQIPSHERFFTDSVIFLKEIYELIKILKMDTPLTEQFIKLMKLIGKFYLNLQAHQPIQFVQSNAWLTIMEFYNVLLKEQSVNELSDEITMVKCCIQGMILIKDTIANYSYAIEKGDKADEEVLSVRNKIDTEYLTEERIINLLELLIIKFLILNPNVDLYLWENDPENWILDDEADHFEFKYRKCAERLLLSIIKKYKNWIVPMLLNILKEYMTPKDNIEQILIKDAIYNGIGLAAHELFNSFDFDHWFNDHLSKELEYYETGTSQMILRYRISWLIGQWIVVKSNKERRHIYYEVLLYLLEKDHIQPESIIYRWSAVNSLKICVDDWDFTSEGFMPYLERAVDQLIILMNQLDELENKMKIMTILSIIVERMEDKITPFAGKIANLLPNLWIAVGSDQNLLKTSIVCMLNKLTKSLGPISENLHELVLPVITHCTDLNDPSHIYLIEEGLELWVNILKNSPRITNQLIQLMPIAIQLIDSNSENIKLVFKILNSYLLLCPNEFIQNHGLELFSNFSLVLIHLRADASELVHQFLDGMLILCNPITYQLSFKQSGLFKDLINGAIKTEEMAYYQVGYLNIIARLCIINPNYFYECFIQCFEDYNSIFLKFINNWVDKYDNIGNIRQQKLHCLAWAYLLALPINHPQLVDILSMMYQQLNNFFTYWSGFLADINESETGDSLAYHQDNNDSDYEGLYGSQEKSNESEVQRKNNMIDLDPIHNIPLLSKLKEKLSEMENYYNNFMIQQQNNERFYQLLEKIDPILLDGLLK